MLLFPSWAGVLFSSLKMQKTIKKDTRSIAHNSLPYLLCSFLYSLQQENSGKGPPFLSCSSFLVFLSFKGEQEKRREREGERRDKRNTILMGRAKKRIEKRDEQRRWRDKTRRKENGTLLYLSSLPSLSLPSFFSKQKNEKGRT